MNDRAMKHNDASAEAVEICVCGHGIETHRSSDIYAPADAGTTINARLGKNGEIIITCVVRREEGASDSVTTSISLAGLIGGAVMGNPADLERYRKALKNVSLELMEGGKI